jgi:hypothetical protein
MPSPSSSPKAPLVPAGNLEAATLAAFVVDDFTAAWDAMARCNPTPETGGDFMFARQTLAYFELACRTGSGYPSDAYLDDFAKRLAERDRRYFTELPGPVPLLRPDEFRFPAVAGPKPDRQLLAALFDTTRHGLAHVAQQTPVTLADRRRWMVSFAGVRPGLEMAGANTRERRRQHLGVRVSSKGHLYLVVRPDVMLRDLEWAARLAAIFSQGLVPDYPERPRRRRKRPRPVQLPAPYQFSSTQLLAALDAGGHARLQ